MQREKKTKFQKALDIVRKEIRKDKGLYVSYQSNIAMAYYDTARQEGSRDSSKKLADVSNRAATYFLALWFMKKGETVRDVIDELNELQED